MIAGGGLFLRRRQMTLRTYIAAAALIAACSGPALASVLVVGSSPARTCFEAADSPLPATRYALERCTEAVTNAASSQYDVVASYVNRGILLMRDERIELAIADFDRALAIDPNQPEASLNKGLAYMRVDDARNALPLFTVALDRHTSRPALAHFGRAIANESLGNIRQAYNDYRRAMEIDPAWTEPQAELARFRVVSR
jgi:tetratricopeptide (TPR) repeat protein